MITEASFHKELQQLFPSEQLLLDPVDCWPYGIDNSRVQAAPEAVVFALDTEQIARLVAFCAQRGISLVTRGRGTGTTGAAVPLRGGIVLSMERMNRILDIDPDNRMMTVEPGVTNGEVQAAAAQAGFFWPPDPTSSAFCTIGGNLACNAAGPRAVKYGTPRENTLGLEAVAGTGEVLRTGVYTTKGVVGYDLTRLLIGSEGTLAVITKATLKLTPQPEQRRLLQAAYADIGSAAAAVARIMAQPATPCALEFMDGAAIRMIRDYAECALPEAAGALLLIELDGDTSQIESATEAVLGAAQCTGCLGIEVARTNADAERLWRTRKALSPALRKLAPKKINEDVVVPVSRIPALINGLTDLGKQHGITIVNFGHAGNGNIHVNLLVNPEDPRELKAAEACLDDVFSLVLRLNGTLSGEHGIGLVKREFVARELDAASIRIMREIKNVFDPAGIMNPDKTIA
jgi:D-lactate dehydrogenase